MEKKIQLENDEEPYTVHEQEKDSEIHKEKPPEIDSNNDSTKKLCEK